VVLGASLLSDELALRTFTLLILPPAFDARAMSTPDSEDILSGKTIVVEEAAKAANSYLRGNSAMV
jgi:hypothetical protein